MVTMISAADEIRSIPHLTNFRVQGVCGIYCFIHRQSRLHYVGSAVDIARRLSAHVRDSRGISTTLFHRALREFGLASFDLEVLEECQQSELFNREQFYIVLLNAASIDGLNSYVNPATSRFGQAVSQATRDRISASLKGKRNGHVHSKETRALIGQKSKGRYFSPEAREKMSEIGKKRPRELVELVASKIRGLKRTDEQKQRLSISLRGIKRTEETKKRMSEQRKGRVLPKTWRDNISKGLMGRIHSQAEKDKRAATHLGMKRSPEARERMRLAQLNLSPEKKANIDRGRHQKRSEEAKARMRAGCAIRDAKKKADK